MKMVFRSFTYACLAFLLLTSCAGVQGDHMDRDFRTQGLEGQAISLKCIPQAGNPHGLPPQEEREILELARQEILSRHKNVQFVQADGSAGLPKPAYSFEIEIMHDDTEYEVKQRRTASNQYEIGLNLPLDYATRTHFMRAVTARYKVIHLPTTRVVWQITGENEDDEWHESLHLERYPSGRPSNLGPPLSQVLRPVTRKACARLP